MTAESEPAAARDSGWGDLLLVDDDAVFARVLGRALNARGFTVHSAASSGEAIAQLDPDGGLRPDFAILDLNLGGSSGLKLIGAVRRSVPTAASLF